MGIRYVCDYEVEDHSGINYKAVSTSQFELKSLGDVKEFLKAHMEKHGEIHHLHEVISTSVDRSYKAAVTKFYNNGTFAIITKDGDTYHYFYMRKQEFAVWTRNLKTTV